MVSSQYSSETCRLLRIVGLLTPSSLRLRCTMAMLVMSHCTYALPIRIHISDFSDIAEAESNMEKRRQPYSDSSTKTQVRLKSPSVIIEEGFGREISEVRDKSESEYSEDEKISFKSEKRIRA